uniref:Calcium channel flower n=1 Tax=Phlebotomus papatasi TaxID=29031 RepID=A0A1B0FY55_PHLPP
CVLFGLWNCVSIVFGGVGCLVSGVLQVCLGLLVLIVEAPCCCMFVDFVQKVADLADSKPYWYRAAIYCESITEKFVSLMARPGQENVPKDDVPWYLKYGARVLGIVGAFLDTFSVKE